MSTKHGEHVWEADDHADVPNIVATAYRRLQSHPCFHDRCHTIGIESSEGRLILTGRLPSFYLKQLAQEALRGLAWPLVNRIDVVCSDGVSSTRVNAKSELASPWQASALEPAYSDYAYPDYDGQHVHSSRTREVVR